MLLVKVKVNTSKMDNAILQYKKHTSKTVAEIVNTKCYFIATQAAKETRHASVADIRKEFGQIVKVKWTDKKGRKRNTAQFVAGKMWGVGDGGEVPKSAVLINAKRKKEGLEPLVGKELIAEMRKLYASKVRSINFLRAGWIPAMKKLAALSDKRGAPQRDNSVKMIGKPKGTAIPGNVSAIMKAQCTIINSVAGSGGIKSSYADNIKSLGLQKAINLEAESTIKYIREKMNGVANKTINNK